MVIVVIITYHVYLDVYLSDADHYYYAPEAVRAAARPLQVSSAKKPDAG